MKTSKWMIVPGMLVAASLPIATVISCGSGVEGPRVVLVLSDSTSTENDQGFNQQGNEAINEFLGLVKDDEENIYSQYDSSKVASPQSASPADLKQQYANQPDDSIIVAIGFQHAAALDSATEEITNKEVILVDTSPSNPISNVAAVEYKAEQAGYIAGYTLAQYASTEAGFNELKSASGSVADDENKVQISAFAGADMPSVSGVAGGFEFGVWDAVHEMTNKEGYPNAEYVEFTYLGNERDSHITNFTPGGGDTVIGNMESKGVDVLFPFAGPQTQDTLDDYTGKIIGADAPQEDIYTDAKYEGRILFSVLKNVKTSVLNLLLKLNEMDIPGEFDSEYKGLNNTTWGTLENNLVGVSDNTEAINTLVAAFKNNTDLMARVQKVDPNKFIATKTGEESTKDYTEGWYNN